MIEEEFLKQLKLWILNDVYIYLLPPSFDIALGTVLWCRISATQLIIEWVHFLYFRGKERPVTHEGSVI